MDITTMKHIAPSETRRERSVRPQTTYRLVSPSCLSSQGMTLPVAGLVGAVAVAPRGAVAATPAIGAVFGTTAMNHTSIDAFSFRRGRPPV